MELEDLKLTWQEMSHQLDKHKQLNDKLIMDMTKLKFSNKIKTIANYEGLGAIILFIASIYILMHIKVFDTLPLQLSVAVTLLITIGLPVLSLASVYKMHTIDVSKKGQKSILTEFAKRRSQFLFIQRLGMGLAFVLMFTIMPVMMKIGKGKDFFTDGNSTIFWYLPIGFIILLVFSRWGYKCYRNITKDAEQILGEVEE